MIKNIEKYYCSKCYGDKLRIIEIGSNELIECRKCLNVYDFNGICIDKLIKR